MLSVGEPASTEEEGFILESVQKDAGTQSSEYDFLRGKEEEVYFFRFIIVSYSYRVTDFMPPRESINIHYLYIKASVVFIVNE